MDNNSEKSIKIFETALRTGRRYLAENQNDGYLPTLDETAGSDIEGEIPIGLREIPLKKVIGTSFSGRSNAFAGNFMPLLDGDTEFGLKWKALCGAHLSTGIRDPIKVFEYMNYYYVQEGNKRVSVLKSVGAYSIMAEVTRIIPPRTDDKKNKIYYEFFDFDRRNIYDDLWFSSPGGFTRLLDYAKQYENTHPEIEKDEKYPFLFDAFGDFRRRYLEAGCGDIPINTGDAFLIFAGIYGIPYNSDIETLLKNIKTCIPLYKLEASAHKSIIETDGIVAHKNALGTILSKRSVRASVYFGLPGGPNNSSRVRLHKHAIDYLSYTYGNKLALKLIYLPEDNPYPLISDLAHEKPAAFFIAGTSFESSAVKAALEFRETIFLLCSPKLKKLPISTYFCRFYEALFLLGIIAGAMSAASKIGIIAPHELEILSPAELNAFACGALTVNPRCEIKVIRQSGRLDASGLLAQQKKLALQGADILLKFYPDDIFSAKKSLPDAAADLCLIDSKTGIILKYLAAPVLDWYTFYKNITEKILDDSLGIPPVSQIAGHCHYRWGISSGLVNVLTAANELSLHTVRLFRLFRRLLLEGEISPFDGLDIESDSELYTAASLMDTLTGEIEIIDEPPV